MTASVGYQLASRPNHDIMQELTGEVGRRASSLDKRSKLGQERCVLAHAGDISSAAGGADGGNSWGKLLAC